MLPSSKIKSEFFIISDDCWYEISRFLDAAALSILWSSRFCIPEISPVLLDQMSRRSDLLLVAVKEGWLDLVSFIIGQNRIDLQASYHNMTFQTLLLGTAYRFGHFAMAELLLSSPYAVLNADNNFAIRMASLQGHLRGVKIALADPRVDLRERNLNLWMTYPPIPFAHRKDLLLSSVTEEVTDLLRFIQDQNRIDLRFSYKEGRSNLSLQSALLRTAYKHNSGGLMEVLITHPTFDPNLNNSYALRTASQHGHSEMVKFLLSDPRVDPSAVNNQAILVACYGHPEVVKLLLTDPRVDPSADDNIAIQTASSNGHLEVVRLLLTDSRVDPSANNNYAINMASSNGHLEVVRLLLTDPRVNPSTVNNYAIRNASSNGHSEVVRLLLTDSRVDPSADNNYALRTAYQKGYLKVVELLLTSVRI